jgi:hypothetical protein
LSLAGQAQAKTRQKILKTPIGAAFEAFSVKRRANTGVQRFRQAFADSVLRAPASTRRARCANGRSPMKAYVATTGAVFVLITLAHILRIVLEGSRLAKSPFFILVTLIAAALAIWAWRLLRQRP